MCVVKAGGRSLDGVDVAKETVIQGSVAVGGAPLPGAYVRLLDASGEFTAEVQTSATGEFRFFAAPGEWTLRVLSPRGNAEKTVKAARGIPAEVTVEV